MDNIGRNRYIRSGFTMAQQAAMIACIAATSVVTTTAATH